MIKRLLFAFALAYSFSILVARWGTSLNSPHAFRETQTAMTVYWMVHDDEKIRFRPNQDRPNVSTGVPLWPRHRAFTAWAASWINYQTPVLGPPYTIPYEFPTFQWIVAGVVYATRIPLDGAGRLVSWLFQLACLLPIWKLALRYDIDPFIVAVLFLVSPGYLYWGTAFLIETCSLFLCLMFLWMVEEKRWVLGLIIGCLAAMTKVTTFLPIALLALIGAGWMSFVPVTCAIAAAVFWNHWCDLLKSQNPLSTVLMSNQPAQQLHNFGTLAQRLSWQPWVTIWDSVKGLI